jgi:lactoylglutathione lyase
VSAAVGRLFETHRTVSDLGRSVAFCGEHVGRSLVLELPERGAAFFWVGWPGEAMLGLRSLGSAPISVSLHVAFKAILKEVLRACDRLRHMGVMPLASFATETNEPSVIGWMPAAAVYFRDPDGHLLEYLAMLDPEPRPEHGVLPWSQWQRDCGMEPARRGVPDDGAGRRRSVPPWGTDSPAFWGKYACGAMGAAAQRFHRVAMLRIASGKAQRGVRAVAPGPAIAVARPAVLIA